jgi:hypothetical protein
MYPLLEHVVPRMKMGAIYSMMQVELAKLPPGATDDEVRKVAAKVVDAVDARLGQMIYDNRFWHRATKEVMMAGIRSVGWNVGTLDVTIGARRSSRSEREGPRGQAARRQTWHKVQYLAALAGHRGALRRDLHVPAHRRGAPKGWKDYYFPRTGTTNKDGNPDRMTPRRT